MFILFLLLGSNGVPDGRVSNSISWIKKMSLREANYATKQPKFMGGFKSVFCLRQNYLFKTGVALS